MREKLGRDRRIDALLIIAIIISAFIIMIPFLIPRPLPETTLRILTRYDLSFANQIEEIFLSSSYADEYNIVDIEWEGPATSMWDAYAQSGQIDLVMADLPIMSQLIDSNSFRPIEGSLVSQVSETIAGVSMKRYSEGLPVWCSYGIQVTIFELLVNETLLQAFGLTTPDAIEDLLTPDFLLYESNSSLIGLDIPEPLSIGHQFQHILTKKLGWEVGIKDLTLLYANSQVYPSEGDALAALLRGEIAIALTTSRERDSMSFPPTISYVHLEDMVRVTPHPIAIANGTLHQSQSEAFIEFLLSPEGQSSLLEAALGLLPVRREAFNVMQDEIETSLYEEFNWTIRAGGPGVSDLYSPEDIALRVYMNSTVFSAWQNLTLTWKNIVSAYENGSIDYAQFNQFGEMLGEPLSIINPNIHTNESFTEAYSISILNNLSNTEFLVEVTRLWRVVANQRYETLRTMLSGLIHPYARI